MASRSPGASLHRPAAALACLLGIVGFFSGCGTPKPEVFPNREQMTTLLADPDSPFSRRRWDYPNIYIARLNTDYRYKSSTPGERRREVMDGSTNLLRVLHSLQEGKTTLDKPLAVELDAALKGSNIRMLTKK